MLTIVVQYNYGPVLSVTHSLSTVCSCAHTGAPHKPPGPRDFCSGDYVQVMDDATLADNQDLLSLVSHVNLVMLFYYISITIAPLLPFIGFVMYTCTMKININGEMFQSHVQHVMNHMYCQTDTVDRDIFAGKIFRL